jgi:hypothetical protein
MAMPISNGDSRTSSTDPTSRSNMRFRTREDGDRPNPRTPSSTWPPRSSNTTDVPITSSMRGSTPTRTPHAVAIRMMSTTSLSPS